MLLELPGLEIKMCEWSKTIGGPEAGFRWRPAGMASRSAVQPSYWRREGSIRSIAAVGIMFPFREDEAPCCIVCGL